MKPRNLDLNLLVLFDALYRLRSVQAASNETAMSPSAFSHALSRLRESLRDELFVRTGNVMRPTALADDIAPAVANALKLLDDGLRGVRAFDPATSDRTFVFAATDYTTLILLPRLAAHLSTVAPGLRIQVVQSGQKIPLEDLASGAIDFALGYTDDSGGSTPTVRDFDWFTDRYVVVTRRSHPLAQTRMTLRQYLAARHVVVTPWGQAKGAIDFELDKLGLRRQVAIRVPSVLAAPFIVKSTDMVMTIPRRAAQILQNVVPITIHPPPFQIKPYRLKAYCHVKRFGEPAYKWMREAMLQVMSKETRGDPVRRQ